MRVAVVNYGMGNPARCAERWKISRWRSRLPSTRPRLFDANRVILPGSARLERGWRGCGLPAGWTRCSGSCSTPASRCWAFVSGMQMPGERGARRMASTGLNLIPGRVRRLDALGCSLRIPHVGWNEVRHRNGTPLFAQIPQGMDFYFVHSYALRRRRSGRYRRNDGVRRADDGRRSQGHVFGIAVSSRREVSATCGPTSAEEPPLTLSHAEGALAIPDAAVDGLGLVSGVGFDSWRRVVSRCCRRSRSTTLARRTPQAADITACRGQPDHESASEPADGVSSHDRWRQIADSPQRVVAVMQGRR